MCVVVGIGGGWNGSCSTESKQHKPTVFFFLAEWMERQAEAQKENRRHVPWTIIAVGNACCAGHVAARLAERTSNLIAV